MEIFQTNFFFLTKVLKDRLNIWLLRNSEIDPFLWGYLEHPTPFFPKCTKVGMGPAELTQELTLEGREKKNPEAQI